MVRTWLPWLDCKAKAQQARPRRSRRLALTLETLEPRTVPSFLPPVSYSLGLGTLPTQPVIADFDNDGVPDLAVGFNRGPGVPGSVVIYRGDGQGGFTRAATYDVGANPKALRAADINGDGNIDLVTANWYDHDVSVLLGNGDGTFAAPLHFTVGVSPNAQPFDMAVGDFNGDGVPDLAVTNLDSPRDTLSVLLGNGDGTFQPAVSYPVGFEPTSVQAGDLNHDGYDDITVSTAATNTVSVLLSNGDGTFQPAVNYAAGFRPYGHALVDLNGDGNLDIVTVNVIGVHVPNSVSVLLGNGDGTFGPRVDYATGNETPELLAVGDFNGDGIPDIAVNSDNSNQVGVLLGDGQGGLGPMTTYNTPLTSEIVGIAAADLNNDGFTDLVVTAPSTMSVLINDGVWDAPAPAPHSGGVRPDARDADFVLTSLTHNPTDVPFNDGVWNSSAPGRDVGVMAPHWWVVAADATEPIHAGALAGDTQRLAEIGTAAAEIPDLIQSVGALWLTPGALGLDRLGDPLT
jgi:hypothetical protein